VAGPNGNSKRIHTCFLDKFNGLIGIGQVGHDIIYTDNILFNSAKLSQFGLYNNAIVMCIVHDLFGQLNVVLERVMRTVDHHGGKSVIDALFAGFERIPMIQVHADRNFGVFSDCNINDEPRLTLKEAIIDLLEPLGIPVSYGLSFGHIDSMVTIPNGIVARMDADRNTFRITEPAVQ